MEPFSVNAMYMAEGDALHRSAKYVRWRRRCLDKLPRRIPIIRHKVVHIDFVWYHKRYDWDNPLKAAQDTIGTKYGFDDCIILSGTAKIIREFEGKPRFMFRLKHGGLTMFEKLKLFVLRLLKR